jgi:pyrroloquinoline quinone (PQQ) biosynthesis protein C
MHSVELEKEVTSTENILKVLQKHGDRKYVVHHSFLKYIRSQKLSMKQVEVIIAQYWYPIHYFVEFLPKVIAVAPALEIKTNVSKILWQELGEGDVERAHESLYLSTMKDVGFDVDTIVNSKALPATEALMAGYRASTDNPWTAIGFLYGTEVIDLVMVSSVGDSIRNASGADSLPWVDIHVQQEPDHIASVRKTVGVPLTTTQANAIISEANRMWKLWSDFYADIEAEIQKLAVSPSLSNGSLN